MKLTVHPAKLHGDVTVPPSKSLGHRLLLSAFLGGKPDMVALSPLSEDLLATKECIQALSKRTDLDPPDEPPVVLDCRSSASTLRFLLPTAMVLRADVIVKRDPRLAQRPLGPLRQVMETNGCRFAEEADGTLCVTGDLTGGDYVLPGDQSSQFATGLLFALPLTMEGGTLTVTKPIVSRPYIDMTVAVLRWFRVAVQVVETKDYLRFTVPEDQDFVFPDGPREDLFRHRTPLEVEGDWSQAAYWIAANVLDNHLHIHGLPQDSSLQGDRVIEPWAADFQLAEPGETLAFDLTDHPDLLLPLAVLAFGTGTGLVITGAKRLADKESDRVDAAVEILTALGGNAQRTEDGLTLAPGKPYGASAGTETSPDDTDKTSDTTTGTSGETPLVMSGRGDHRVVMALAILATCGDRPITIDGAEAVAKSYPDFFTTLEQVGGRWEWEELR